jgi:hypothetical protein
MSKRPEPTWSEEEVDNLKAEINRLTAENARLKSEQGKLVELLKKLHAASDSVLGVLTTSNRYSVNGIQLIFRVPEYSELSIRTGVRS